MTVSRELLVSILDGIEECFYSVDHEWRITVFNRGAEHHFGLPRQEAVGLDLRDLLGRPSSETMFGRFEEAMATRRACVVEAISLVHPGRLMEGRLFPLEDGLGVAFRDITERRRAEISLKERERELAHVHRIVGIGGLEVDLRDGFANRRSPEYLRLHGLPPESEHESHEDWVARIHPEDRDRTEREFRDAVSGDWSMSTAPSILGGAGFPLSKR